MKTISKFLSLHLVRLQGKLKLTEKEKIYIFLSVSYILQYSNVLVISRFQWLM